MYFFLPVGWPNKSTTFGGRLYGVYRAHWTYACLVLVSMSTSRGCVPRVSENCITFARSEHTVHRWYTQLNKCSFIGNRSSIGFYSHRRCLALCTWRLQRPVVAGVRFKYTWSSIMFTHQCPDADGSLLFDSCYYLIPETRGLWNSIFKAHIYTYIFIYITCCIYFLDLANSVH